MNMVFYPFFISAAVVGGLLPILLPLGLIIYGRIRRNLRLLNTAFALGQAAMLGSAVSSFYKALTGRAHPSLSFRANLPDISHAFRFSWFRNQIFWGWPSSHTAIAFAMAVTFFILSKNKTAKVLALAYAFYIGIGVSATIHWFSDFAAGAIIGTVIGIVVGRSFLARKKLPELSGN